MGFRDAGDAFDTETHPDDLRPWMLEAEGAGFDCRSIRMTPVRFSFKLEMLEMAPCWMPQPRREIPLARN